MPTLDRVYNADVIIDGFHHFTHRGAAFSASDFVTGVTSGANYDILLRSTGGAHLVVAAAGELATSVSIFENVTFSGTGTDIPVRNRNRFFSTGSPLPVDGDASKVQLSHTPTGLGNLTTRLSITYLPGGSYSETASGAATSEFPEWVLNGFDYLIRITNEGGQSGDIYYDLSWYEPLPPSVPQAGSS